MHAVAPGAFCAVPNPHDVQVSEPFVAVYEPAAHCGHCCWFGNELARPAVQFAHVDCPLSSAALPAEHAEHVSAPIVDV